MIEADVSLVSQQEGGVSCFQGTEAVVAGEGDVLGHEADVETWDGGEGVEEGVVEEVCGIEYAETVGRVCGLIGLWKRHMISQGFQPCSRQR